MGSPIFNNLTMANAGHQFHDRTLMTSEIANVITPSCRDRAIAFGFSTVTPAKAGAYTH